MNSQKAKQPHMSTFLMGLSQKIAAAQVVSFDFFDTLFVRPLRAPEDIFDIIGQHFGIANFHQLRRQAQQQAFQEMISRGRKEISLQDIYACFPPQHLPAQQLLQAEYELELNIIEPNPEVAQLYTQAVAQAKSVVIISDMYLPEAFFISALKKHNLPLVPLYVSAARNATKRDYGELYEIVLDSLGIPAEDLLHIGDNQHSDITQAQRKGLQTHFYAQESVSEMAKVVATPLHTSIEAPSVASSLASAFFQRSQHLRDPATPEALGFLYGGPAATGFLDWIAEQSHKDKIDKILFLARDGYVLHQIVEHGVAPHLPPTAYLKGSRVYFLLCTLTHQNFAQLLPELLTGAIGLSAYELFERLGVAPPAETVMDHLGFPDCNKITQSNLIQHARLLTAFRSEILRIAQRNRQVLYGYLHSLGIHSGQRLAIVDVGWNGTTQKFFAQAVQPMFDLHIQGYYFCLANSDHCQQRLKTQKMKALFSSETCSHKQISQLYANRVLIELFFSAPHPSIIGLERVDNKAQHIVDRGRSEDLRLPDTVTALTTGTLGYAQKLYRFKAQTQRNVDCRESAQILVDFAVSGCWKHSNVLADLHNFDAWGSSRNVKVKLADQL